MNDFDKKIESMRWMAEYLMPYCHNDQDRADVAILATHEMCVHGYDISFYLTKDCYPNSYVWRLHMCSKHQGFLPFSLVCECAAKILGDCNLGLVELLGRDRKVYIWRLEVDKDGTPIPLPSRPNVEVCTYDGLTFSVAKAILIQ